MSEFYRYQDKELPELRECVEYISDNYSGEETEHVIQRVLVTSKDQWGGYSETVQEIELRIGEPK